MSEQKPKDIAIAYSIQKKNKRKKMAEGGEAQKKDVNSGAQQIPQNPDKSTVPHPEAADQLRKVFGFDNKAHGGEISHDEMDHAQSISEIIMRRRQKMAQGGEVDLADNAEESGNVADELNMDALGKENYSESAGLDALDEPMDSNEHGDELEDENDHSLSGQIRKKMRMKSRS